MLVAIALVGAAASDARSQTDEKRTLKQGECERTYILHVPKELPKDKAVPLVIWFHGGTEAREYPTQSGKFGELADRDGFIFVMPHAVGGHWNDGRETDFQSFKQKVDDAGFVAAMIAEIEKKHRIEPKRIHAFGISNGAMCSHYIAAVLSEKIAAIAPVVGGMPDPFHKRFKPTQPVSVLIIQGTKDPTLPYEGGKVPDQKLNRGRVLGADNTAKMWVEHNGCRKEPAKEELPDKDPKDGCMVTRFTWSKGRNGTEVVLYKIDGGGHRWPGGNYPQVPTASQAKKAKDLTARLGARCDDFDASEVIWEFFKNHPKP
jgi:polyhydroxybutyrate depolymerase